MSGIPFSDEEILLLTFDELRILLYNAGYRQCEGILMPETEWSGEQIVQTLAALSKRELIFVEGDRFLIHPAIRKILDIIGKPTCTLHFRGVSDGQTYYCYLHPEQVVITELFHNRKNTFRLRVYDREKFDHWREEITDDYHNGKSADAWPVL